MKKFWALYAEGQRLTQGKYETKEVAEADAFRLLNGGLSRIYVLEAIEAIEPEPTPHKITPLA